MPTNTIRKLLGVVVVVAVIAGVARHVHGEGQATSPTSTPDAMPGMDMPKDAKQAPAATTSTMPPAGYADIKINQDVQQRIGVTVGKVEQTPLTMTIRGVGIVRPDETRVAHVHLKTEGWVQKLLVAYTGQKVGAGEPILSIYSPTFFAAQREFLS